MQNKSQNLYEIQNIPNRMYFLHSQFNETASLALGVKNVIVHPRWFNSAGESPGDIALLRLDREGLCNTQLRNISVVLLSKVHVCKTLQVRQLHVQDRARLPADGPHGDLRARVGSSRRMGHHRDGGNSVTGEHQLYLVLEATPLQCTGGFRRRECNKLAAQ